MLSHAPRLSHSSAPSARAPYVGVRQATGGWNASVMFLGHRVYVGKFQDAVAAARAHDRAAVLLMGEAASTNFGAQQALGDAGALAAGMEHAILRVKEELESGLSAGA